MKPAEFTLQPSDIKQPTLLDEDPVTTRWPMPEPRAWKPEPRNGLLQSIADRMLSNTAQFWEICR